MIQKILCCALLLMLLCSAALAEERTVLDPRVQPAVALSFDDGPSEFTQQIIDLLAENDCRATFFMVGTNMDLYPDLVKAVFDSGNEVGLHTWRHNDLNQMSADAIVRNLQLCQNIVLAQTGATAKWLRPPYGRVGPSAYGACTAL
ncbi:MAG: polysaccharide deacetylase family protein, partial [Clostridia bacterium]|nr:polysaccharide deacetylase family protein [Clostridia bacterium]